MILTDSSGNPMHDSAGKESPLEAAARMPRNKLAWVPIAEDGKDDYVEDVVIQQGQNASYRHKLQVPPRDMFPVPGDNIEISKPTIAAVNGVAFAGGWLISQACDLCVASTRAQFAITEVKVGRSSPWGAPLIHMIPQRIMMEIMLTGKPISAQRAYEIGLVNRLAEPEKLLETALALAAEILEGAPLSVAAARQTVMLSTEMGQIGRAHV